MSTIAEIEAECPYLAHFMTGNPHKGMEDAELYKCAALRARVNFTAAGSPSFVDAVCLRDCGVPELEEQGLDPMLDPYFAHLVHNARLGMIHHGFKNPSMFTRPDFMEQLVRDVKAIGGKSQAREAVLAAIRNGLDATDGQKLIDDVIEEVS